MTVSTLTFDYSVKTAAGALIRTFDCHRKAIKYAASKRDEFPGIYVDRTTTTVNVTRLWTDRIAVRRAA